MADFYERLVQNIDVKQLESSAQNFKAAVQFIGILGIVASILCGLLALFTAKFEFFFVALAWLLPSLTLLFFGKLMYHLSSVTIATFQMTFEDKQQRLKKDGIDLE